MGFETLSPVLCESDYVEQQRRLCSHPPGKGRCLACCDLPQRVNNTNAAENVMARHRLPEAIVLSRQLYRRVDEVHFRRKDALLRFLKPWEQNDGASQRAGILFGSFIRTKTSRSGLSGLLQPLKQSGCLNRGPESAVLIFSTIRWLLLPTTAQPVSLTDQPALSE